MSDLLTTRQLQELLQVDRITIYRMLNDGRLTGFKVGGQWRFSRQEIEKWLQERRAAPKGAERPTISDEERSPSDPLPLSCVQAIQSLYAEAADIAAMTTEPDGTLLTEVSDSCEFCNLVLSTEQGRRRCATSWQPLSSSQLSPPPVHTCHAGLLCISMPIVVENQWVANIASCQFIIQSSESPGKTWQADLPSLAAELGLHESELQAAGGVRVLSDKQVSRAAHLLEKVAGVLCEIGEERQKFVKRLQRIAEITNI